MRPSHSCWIAALFVIVLESITGNAAQPQWYRNLEEGQDAARRADKDLLIVFTGIGWCAHCEILDREVLQQPEFEEATHDQFVLVELDFTFGESPEEQQRKTKYNEMAERFLVTGYPTVILADSQLRPFAYFVGYEDSYGAQRYLEGVSAAIKDYQSYLALTKELPLPSDQDGLSKQAKALSKVAEHLSVDDDCGDPLLHFYALDVSRMVSELPEDNQDRQRIASRQKDQLLRVERKSTWDPIEKRLDNFYSAKAWNEAIEYIEKTLPTLNDPYLQLRLEYQYLNTLRQDGKCSEALALARRMQDRGDLDNERRLGLGNTEAQILLKLGKVDEAIAKYDERIAAAEVAGDRSQKSWLLAWKAQLMWSTDRLAETIAVCRASRDAAVHDSDDWLTATFLLATKLRKAGEFEEALQLSTEQLQVQRHGMVLLDIAESLIGLNRIEEAVERIGEADKEVAKLRKSARSGDRDDADRIADRAASLRKKLPATN